ncbi:hypothetical protein CABS01_10302 [Colletotrichum abscissum]|uniref:Uncharacterized protein n=1 Tax=Colletotrichum abscissum TaxID=1671311 RepID=A0A9P9XNJ4_9PEZI|nr:uncharacterized protein CABS01_10302 [Colletotrichum abscissum]KAI3557064.1 hypothetical protein CABS02_02615 [Colletotrichum abscissum]KAK1499904.1 hypothetical protein CABS01_10302 [Colletotrichum abscissum]
MTCLQSLPPETILQIAACSDLSFSCLRHLRLTCRGLAVYIAPLLYRKAVRDHAVLLRLVRNDQSDIILRVLKSQIRPNCVAPQHYLDSCLHDALLGGHLKAADVLFGNGAEPVFSIDVANRSEHRETRDWLQVHDATGLGSLALAARSRYHMTFWYKDFEPYTSEEEFWIYKKKAMKTILEKLRSHFGRDSDQYGLKISEAHYLRDEHEDEKKEPMLRHPKYARELDMALAEAATADGHSIELMDFLFGCGATVTCELTPQLAGHAWHNALNEEIPALFEAKVDLLLRHGVDPTSVWTWEGMRTPIQFFLRKLYRNFQYFEEPGAFTNKVFGYMEYLESRGCLRWPRSTLRSFVLSVGTVQINCIIDYPRAEEHDDMSTTSLIEDATDGRRELELIFKEPDPSLLPLRVALSNQIALKHFRDLVILPSPTFREWVDKESMSNAIQDLDRMFRTFSVSSPSVESTRAAEDQLSENHPGPEAESSS